MTDSPPADAPAESSLQASRPYSPGLEGVIAGETSLSYIDGAAGRLLYRGYRIGDLVEHGTYPAVANLLWTGEWDPAHRLPTGPIPDAVLQGRVAQADKRALPRERREPMTLRPPVVAMRERKPCRRFRTSRLGW